MRAGIFLPLFIFLVKMINKRNSIQGDKNTATNKNDNHRYVYVRDQMHQYNLIKTYHFFLSILPVVCCYFRFLLHAG